MCEWEAQEGWVLDPILVGLEKWGKLTNFSNMVYQKVRQQATRKLVTTFLANFTNLMFMLTDRTKTRTNETRETVELLGRNREVQN